MPCLTRPMQCERTTAETVTPGAVSFFDSPNSFAPRSRRCSPLDFPHDHARSRAYRWGEDGIAGVCDTHGLQNIAFAFWNEKEYGPLRPVLGVRLADCCGLAPF